jgi:hypothetical protein
MPDEALTGILIFGFPYILGLVTLYSIISWYAPEAWYFVKAGIGKKDLLSRYAGHRKQKLYLEDKEDDKSLYFRDEKKNVFKADRSLFDDRGYTVIGNGRTQKRIYHYYTWLLPSDAYQIKKINDFIAHIRTAVVTDDEDSAEVKENTRYSRRSKMPRIKSLSTG